MRNFEKKGIWKIIMQSKPILILLGVLIVIFAWNIFRLWNKMEETSRNKKVAENKVAELKFQKEKLLADINSLSTDAGKEKVFRENFGLAKEGEDMIVIVEDKNISKTSKEASSPGFFSFLRSLFK